MNGYIKGSDLLTPFPPPDEDQQADDLETRQFYHMFRDLCNATERKGIQVETPRVHVGQDHFDRFDIGVERETQEHGGWTHPREVSVGQPELVIKAEWVAVEPDLTNDIRDHLAFEGPIILYGDMHLWRMDEQCGNVEWGATAMGLPNAEAELRWRKAEPVGWV